MTAEEEHDDEQMEDVDASAPAGEGSDEAPKKQKRSKPRRQSGTAAAHQKRASVRKLPERTTSSHLVERKGKNQLAALQGGPRQDRRGSQGAIKAATSAMRVARGVPAKRGVSRAASSQNAPRRPDRNVAPGKKSTPARSSSTHSLKPFKRGGQGTEPTLTGADLLNLRKAQKADNTDADSVQSDVESTYTMDSINLRKSQIKHDHEHEEIVQQMRDAGLDDDDESVSTLETTEDGVLTDFEALADEAEDEVDGEVFAIQDGK